MFASIWRSAFLALLATALLALVPLTPAWAGDDDDDEPEVIAPPARAVRDHLEVFSPEVRTKANLVVAETRTLWKTDLVIETLKAPPLPDTVKADDPKDVAAYYAGWLLKNIKDAKGLKGIHIAFFPMEKKVICLVGPETQKAFPAVKAQDLPKKVEAKMLGKDMDGALALAIFLVREGLPKLKERTIKTDSDTWFSDLLDEDDEEAKDKPSKKGEAPMEQAEDGDGESEVLEAPTPAIRDEMNLFSPAARSRANETVAKMRERFGFKLIVESRKAPSLPADVDEADSKAVYRYYEDMLLKHAKEVLGKEGILVAIFPEVQKTFCFVGPGTQKLFGVAEAKKVPSQIEPALKAKDYDDALDTVVAFVASHLPPLTDIAVKTDNATWFSKDKDKAGAGAREGQGGKTPWVTYLLIAIGVVVVLWLVMAIVRGMSNRNRAPAPGEQVAGQPAGGGGFMRGFLGGLVGAAAGMWLYNSFFGGQSAAWGGQAENPVDSSADPADSPEEWGGGGEDYGSDGDADWGGGGGDWGD